MDASNIFSEYIIVILLLLFIPAQSAVYYVTTDEQHRDCPGECHTFSHYTNKSDWPVNTTLIFLPGEHRMTSTLSLVGLHNVLLKGEVIYGGKMPVIVSGRTCTNEWFIVDEEIEAIKYSKGNFIKVNVSNCGAVTIKDLRFEGTVLAFVNNLEISIANIMSVGSLFLNNDPQKVPKMSSILISNSEFQACSVLCVYIQFTFGNLLLHETIISNQYGDIGPSIFCGSRSNVTLSGVSVHGTRIVVSGDSYNAISLIGVTANDDTKGQSILLDFRHQNKLRLTNVTVSSNDSLSKSVGITAISLSYNNITMNGVQIINSNDEGLYALCELGHCVFNLTDITILNVTNYYGLSIDSKSTLLSISNTTVRNCGSGITVTLNENSIASLSNVTAASNLGDGIDIRCDGSHYSTIKLFNMTSRCNFGSGIAIIYSGKNEFHLSGVILANNKQAGLKVQGSLEGSIALFNVTITDNTPSGMAVLRASKIKFINHSSIIANNYSPSNGGGMWIADGTTIYSDTTVYFVNNTAQGVGGALYVADIADVAYIVYYYRPCTISSNFFPIFENNSALITGDNIYNGAYWKCTYSDFEKTRRVVIKPSDAFLVEIDCSVNPLFSHFKTPISSYVTSNPFGVCLCINNSIIDCGIRSIKSRVYPGQNVTISLVTVGVCGGLSPSVLIASRITDTVRITPINENQETRNKCKNFAYRVNQQNTSMDEGEAEIGIGKTAANFKSNDSQLIMHIKFQKCPLGLRVVSGACNCDSIIGAVNGTQCDINTMPHPISRSGNNWLYYSEDYRCVIAYSNCPFDYCNASTVSLNLNESDLQCTNGRSGILCGRCQPGLSLMLGSNKCGSCNDRYLLLLVVFILAGIILVIFLLVCNLTVSVGSINGLLFYANMIKLNEVALFPDGVSIPVLSQFIAWLNLDLGIETCFYNGLDGYWKTWLQFAFPIYIWLLISFIIIGCYYSGRLSRLCGNNSVPVLATLVLMSFTKLLRTITNTLMVAKIKCEDKCWITWSVDANIGYLSIKHTLLFLVALLFLFVGLVYTVLLLSSQWLQRYSGKCCRSSRDPVVKLKPFIDAYTGPYKDKYRYWTGLLLMVRILLTPIFSYTTGTVPQINNYIMGLISFTILYFSRSVYRSKPINLLSSFHYYNLGSLVLFSALSDHMGFGLNVKIASAALSVSIALVFFIVSVLAHAFITSFHSKTKRCNSDISDRIIIEDNGEVLYSPAAVVSRRESLIFDFEL